MDSPPFQRLRYIHQLAMTFLVYPAATHRRFEHSLGVMELATRVYETLTRPENIQHDAMRELSESKRDYWNWRTVLRMAALCHDMGHLPFSHAAEKELLPDGWDHERMTREIVMSDELVQVWSRLNVKAEDVAKLAVGPKKYGQQFSDIEAVLSEIITGDAFGVDRMDYLLRDSLHAGVAYGRFDHYRLIDTMRVLPRTAGSSNEPVLGVELGGLHSAEALLLARYFMFSQLYCHDVRRIYDIHLKDFLKEWLPNGTFSTDPADHIRLTDNEVTAALMEAARDSSSKGHDAARRIVERQHFRLLYERNPADIARNPGAARQVFESASKQFGAGDVRLDSYRQKGSSADFPVLCDNKDIQSSLVMSEVLRQVPLVAVEYVFIAPEQREKAMTWLKAEHDRIIKPERGAS